jgi:hypothetical protein
MCVQFRKLLVIGGEVELHTHLINVVSASGSLYLICKPVYILDHCFSTFLVPRTPSPQPFWYCAAPPQNYLVQFVEGVVSSRFLLQCRSKKSYKKLKTYRCTI